MTAQIGDVYKLNDKAYRTIARNPFPVFRPQDYGLIPHPSSTACSSGYWCEFWLDDEQLRLKNLFLYNKDGDYPGLNEVEADPPEYYEAECEQLGRPGRRFVTLPKFFGHRVYRNVDLLVPYTGKVLVGSNFIDKYYVHAGLQFSWAYKTVLELSFEEGLLIVQKDYSELGREQRRNIQKMQKEAKAQGKESASAWEIACKCPPPTDEQWWRK